MMSYSAYFHPQKLRQAGHQPRSKFKKRKRKTYGREVSLLLDVPKVAFVAHRRHRMVRGDFKMSRSVAQREVLLQDRWPAVVRAAMFSELAELCVLDLLMDCVVSMFRRAVKCQCLARDTGMGQIEVSWLGVRGALLGRPSKVVLETVR